jgi:hypothetical protein
MARLNRDLSGVTKEQMERTGGWKAREPGDYLFLINNSDYKETKSGEGMCLHLELQCVERGHQRFKMRDFLTLEHPNPTVVEIANARLKQLAIAVGHPKPDFIGDSKELHNKRFVAVITKEKVEQYGDADGFQNRVVGYKPVPAKAASPARETEYDESEPPPHTDHDRMREPAF